MRYCAVVELEMMLSDLYRYRAKAIHFKNIVEPRKIKLRQKVHLRMAFAAVPKLQLDY